MKYLKQISYIFLICVAGELISKLLGGKVPGNVLAMVILFLLLMTKLIKLESVQQTSDFILANMAFFFLPATVSVFFDYKVFADQLLKLFLIIFITTILTSLSAGYTVKLVLKYQNARRKTNE